MTSRIRKLTNAMLLCGLACGSQSAFSATTTLQYQGAKYGFDSSVSGTIYADFNPSTTALESKGVYAGGFKMLNTSANPDQPLLAWCVDVFHTLSSSFDYASGSASTLNHSNDLQKLVNQRFSQVTDKNTSAAFQLAVWEIVTETTVGPYSLSNGTFKATGFSNAPPGGLTALALASSWLKLDGTSTGNYKIAYFYDDIVDNKYTQNLISMSPVPLPGAAVLMLSALGLGGGLLRRRSKKADA